MTSLRAHHTLFCLYTFLGCAGAPPPQAPKVGGSPAAKQRLEMATTAHRETLESLAAIPPRDRETCEFQVGDCSLVVKEREDGLLQAEEMSTCQVLPDVGAREQCMADRLVAKGQHQELADYYTFHDSCTRQVLTCVEGLAVRAAASAVESRVRARRDEVEQSDRSAASRARVEGTKAGVAYLRATLPPAVERACDLAESVNSCTARTLPKRHELDAELRSDSFHLARATALSAELARAEAECRAPEITCLEGALASYGLLPDARKVTARNLELLIRREELKGRVSSRAAGGCLTRPTGEHQQRIVSAYVAYVREPVLYFRRELDRAFRDLHESQVACLTARVHAQPTGAGPSAQR